MAKQAADSAAAIYKSAPVFVMQARIYAAMANDPATAGLAADPNWEAFHALQKAVAADKDYVNQTLAQGKLQLANTIYSGLTNGGMVAYNAAAERNNAAGFALALEIFKKAASVGQFIFENNWGKSGIDTVSLLYLSKSAINADKEADALFYSKKIVDNYIIYLPFKLQYETVFQWLVYYYKNKNDAVAFARYVNAGKEVFPGSGYFSLAEMDWYRDHKQYRALFDKYRGLFATGKNGAAFKLAYYRDMFSYRWPLYGKSTAINSSGGSKELVDGLQLLTKEAAKDIALQASLLLAKVYINQAGDIDKAILQLPVKDDKTAIAYKTQRHHLLLLADKYLRLVTADKTFAVQPAGREAAALRKTNRILLRKR